MSIELGIGTFQPTRQAAWLNNYRSRYRLRVGPPLAHIARNRSLRVGREVLKNNQGATQDIAELIRLHDDVLARVFALQTLLQDLGVLSPENVQQRAEELRRQFALDLETRLGAEESRSRTKP